MSPTSYLAAPPRVGIPQYRLFQCREQLPQDGKNRPGVDKLARIVPRERDTVRATGLVRQRVRATEDSRLAATLEGNLLPFTLVDAMGHDAHDWQVGNLADEPAQFPVREVPLDVEVMRRVDVHAVHDVERAVLDRVQDRTALRFSPAAVSLDPGAVPKVPEEVQVVGRQQRAVAAGIRLGIAAADDVEDG